MLRRLAFRHRSAFMGLVGTGIAAQALEAPPATAGEVATGVLVALLGAHLRLVSIRVLGKSARVHHAGGRALHVVGPYARVRNPLYVANALITGGLALLAAGPVAMATAFAVVALIYDLAVRHEEEALTEAFGDEYREYRRLVPRWFPRLGASRATDDPPAPVPWREVLVRERPLVVGVPVALVATYLVRAAHVPLVDFWDRLSWSVGVPPVPLLVLVGGLVCLANGLRTERKLRRKEAWRAAVAAAPPAEGGATPVQSVQDLNVPAQ